jgi:hypothetical protein
VALYPLFEPDRRPQLRDPGVDLTAVEIAVLGHQGHQRERQRVDLAVNRDVVAALGVLEQGDEQERQDRRVIVLITSCQVSVLWKAKIVGIHARTPTAQAAKNPAWPTRFETRSAK